MTIPPTPASRAGTPEEPTRCVCTHTGDQHHFFGGQCFRCECKMFTLVATPPAPAADAPRSAEDDLVWRDWSSAAPISQERRDEWATEARRNPNILMSRCGDSAMYCAYDGDGEYMLTDVVVRRTARFRGPPPRAALEESQALTTVATLEARLRDAERPHREWALANVRRAEPGVKCPQHPSLGDGLEAGCTACWHEMGRREGQVEAGAYYTLEEVMADLRSATPPSAVLIETPEEPYCVECGTYLDGWVIERSEYDPRLCVECADDDDPEPSGPPTEETTP